MKDQIWFSHPRRPPKVWTGHDDVSEELFHVLVVGRVDDEGNNDCLLASKDHSIFTR